MYIIIRIILEPWGSCRLPQAFFFLNCRWMFCAFAVWGYILVTILYICCAGLGLHPGDCFVHLLCRFGVTSRWLFCTLLLCGFGITVTCRWMFCTLLLCRFGVPICNLLPHIHDEACVHRPETLCRFDVSRWLFCAFAVQVWGTHMQRTTPRT